MSRLPRQRPVDLNAIKPTIRICVQQAQFGVKQWHCFNARSAGFGDSPAEAYINWAFAATNFGRRAIRNQA